VERRPDTQIMISRSWLTRNSCNGCLAGSFRRGVLLALIASAVSGSAQTRLGTEVRLQYADMAVLEASEPHKDLSCQLTPDRPYLGFDLRFHAHYRVTVPIKVLVDSGGWLQVVMRVRPTGDSEQPVYLAHRLTIPDFPLGVKGEGLLAGGFDLGLGRYQVDWLMRDGGGRVCSSHWKLEASLGGGQDLPLTLAPNMVTGREEVSSADEPALERPATPPLHVKILLNLSPAKPQESILKPHEAAVLLSILRGITREPGVSRFSVVAFNLRAQKIIYREESADKIDFAALSKAAQLPTAGTVNYRLLRDSHSETHFVTTLLTDQLGTQTAPSDAVIIIGRKFTLEKKVSLDQLKTGGRAPYPIFYLNYSPNPFDEPFADAIGSALKAYKGALAYNIVLPHDLGVALRDMLSRIRKRSASEAAISSPLGMRDGAAFQQ
jgi:hypothetical protein